MADLEKLFGLKKLEENAKSMHFVQIVKLLTSHIEGLFISDIVQLLKEQGRENVEIFQITIQCSMILARYPQYFDEITAKKKPGTQTIDMFLRIKPEWRKKIKVPETPKPLVDA